MKILFVNENLDYGGAGKVLVWLANSLAENGYEVTFLTYRKGKERLSLTDNIRKTQFILNEEESGARNVIKTAVLLRKYLKENCFDTAVAFSEPSQTRLAVAAAGLNTRCVFSQRLDPYTVEKKALMKLVYSKADYFVFQTEGARQYYSEKIRKRSTVIPNPVIPTGTVALSEDRQKKIVSVGRLDIFQKRQDLLIEAFKKIAADYPDYILEFLGDGPDMEKLKVMSSDMTDRILFPGVSESVQKDIRKASMFVLSSDFEGIPNALMEAMSLGVPCISTDCRPGGAAEILINGENGLLVPAGDSDKLAEAMKKYIDDPEFAEQMGRNAINIAVTFSQEKILDQWISVIERV